MFAQVKSLDVVASNANQLIKGLEKSELILELSASDTFRDGSLIEPLFKSGNVFRVRWIQSGIKGRLLSLPYGTSDIIFDIPILDSPFDIELIPGRLQFKYSVKVFQREESNKFLELADFLGLSLTEINRIPSNFLELMNLMANPSQTPGDTRGLRATQRAMQQQIDQNVTDLTAAKTQVTEISSTMLISEKTSLAQSAFVLNANGYYYAPVLLSTIDGLEGVDTTVVDNQGDEQGLVQVIAKYQGNVQMVALELDDEQYAGASFPLAVTFQGKKIAVASGGSGVGMTGYAVPGTPSIVRYNGSIQSGTVERSNDAGVTWYRINDAANIESAKIAADGQIHVKTKDNLYFYSLIENGQWLGSNSGNYDGLTAAVGAVVL